MRRSIAVDGGDPPNRFVTPMISTSGAEAPAVSRADGAGDLAAGGASVVGEAVNGGSSSSVPVAEHIAVAVLQGRCIVGARPSERQRAVGVRILALLPGRGSSRRHGVDAEPILQARSRRILLRPQGTPVTVTELQLGTPDPRPSSGAPPHAARRRGSRRRHRELPVPGRARRHEPVDRHGPAGRPGARAVDLAAVRRGAETGRVVRREARRRVAYPGCGPSMSSSPRTWPDACR